MGRDLKAVWCSCIRASVVEVFVRMVHVVQRVLCGHNKFNEFGLRATRVIQ